MHIHEVLQSLITATSGKPKATNKIRASLLWFCLWFKWFCSCLASVQACFWKTCQIKTHENINTYRQAERVKKTSPSNLTFILTQVSRWHQSQAVALEFCEVKKYGACFPFTIDVHPQYIKYAFLYLYIHANIDVIPALRSSEVILIRETQEMFTLRARGLTFLDFVLWFLGQKHSFHAMSSELLAQDGAKTSFGSL